MVICFSLAAGTRMSHSPSKRFSSVIYLNKNKNKIFNQCMLQKGKQLSSMHKDISKLTQTLD